MASPYSCPVLRECEYSELLCFSFIFSLLVKKPSTSEVEFALSFNVGPGPVSIGISVGKANPSVKSVKSKASVK